MGVVSIEVDEALTRFVVAVNEVGSSTARLAMSRALNHEGAKLLTQIRRAVVRQTSIRRELVTRNVRPIKSTRYTLEYAIRGFGRPMQIGEFQPREFRYGVRAKVWGRFQRFKSAFIVPAYGGKVFVRKGAERFPLKGLYGPGIANELVRGDVLETFERATPALRRRLEHELARLAP